jgi:peroxiredoxin Q/BCP
MKNSLFTLALLLSLTGVVPVFALQPGDTAPAFSLKSQSGKTVTLAENKGKPVLLYFYPKDETPGCTKEACMLRDRFTQFQKKGAVIYGISMQDEKSHTEFKAKHKLPFDLLVDPTGAIAAKYGVQKMGSDFLERKSVLVGPDGKVFRYYESVDPATHADQVLSALGELKS